MRETLGLGTAAQVGRDAAWRTGAGSTASSSSAAQGMSDGALTVVVKPPWSAETLRKNPLGLCVDAIDWGQELDPAAPTPKPAFSAAPPPSTPQTSLPFGSPLDPHLADALPVQLPPDQPRTRS